MKNLNFAIRDLLRNKQDNIIKILSLALGFSVGIVLLAKVNFELNYDNYYPNNDRIYSVGTNFLDKDKPDEQGRLHPRVSGAVVPAMKLEIPEIEEATRFMYIAGNAVFYNQARNKYKGTFILADSCFFEVMPRTMIIGNAKDILSKPMHAMISKSKAEMMGGDVIGEPIELDIYPNKIITIAGIYEDLPANSSYSYDVIVSLSSIENFMWDGRNNWIGNDRYFGYIKLKENTNLENLPSQFRKIQKKYQNIEEWIEKGNNDFSYQITPISEVHSNKEDIQRMLKILSVIAIALLFTAIMNYMLFVITSVVDKARNVAIHKCYGAESNDIARMTFVETLLHFVLALFIASILIFIFQQMIQDLIGVGITDLFNIQSSPIVLGVLIIIFFISALAPMYMFSRLPIASIFRTFKKNRKNWKLALLFIQFTAATFLLIFLLVVGTQYKFMINSDVGYEYENLISSSTSGISDSEAEVIENRLKELPEVQSVSRSSTLLHHHPSGNYVRLLDNETETFIASDIEFVGANYISTMGIEMIEGQAFGQNSIKGEMLIGQSFAKKLETMGMTDGVLGKSVCVTGGDYGESCIIKGIYKDVLLGNLRNTDTRPSMMFYAPDRGYNIVIKLSAVNGENISKVQKIFEEVAPNKNIVINSHKQAIIDNYMEDNKLKETITIGGIITLLISIIGLIGYINNEVLRRSSEIAVRKINGATTSNILSLFAKSILWITIPALIGGSLCALFAASSWMESFSQRITLSPLIFIAGSLAILLIIQAVVLLNCLKIANQNPVDSLKSE